MIKALYILPHPPLMVDGFGDASKMEDTIEAVSAVSRKIKRIEPETLVVITPHASVYRDFIDIQTAPVLEGSFDSFGKSDIQYQFQNDVELAKQIIAQCKSMDLSVGTIDDKKGFKSMKDSLDHGVLVPLSFIQKEIDDRKIVVVPIAGFPYRDLYRTGQAIAKAVTHTKTRTVVIASCDLSHKLKTDGPYGYAKEGPAFDQKVKKYIENDDPNALMEMDPAFIDRAAQCGLPSVIMGFGTLHGQKREVQVMSYEGPYGVGYLVASIRPL